MTTMDQALGFFKSLRQQDKDTEATRQDHRDFLFNQMKFYQQEGRQQKRLKFDIAKDQLDRENDDVDANLVQFGAVLEKATGPAYDHALASSQSYVKNLPKYQQRRKAAWLNDSVMGEKQQALKAHRERYPKRPPVSDSPEGEDQGSIFDMADRQWYEFDRLEGETAIKTGKPANPGTNHMIKVGPETWSSRRSNGTFDFHTEDVMAKKEWDENYTGSGAGVSAGNGVSTPWGNTKSMAVIGKDGKKYTTTTNTYAPGMLPPDAEDVRFNLQGDAYTEYTTPDASDIAAATKDHREMTVAYQNLIANPGYYKKAFKGEKSISTNESAIVAFWNTIQAGRSVQQALDGLALSTPGHIPLLLKAGDWEESFFGKATFAHNANENLVFREGRYEIFKTSDGKEVRLIVEPDGRVIDPKKMFGSPDGWWAGDVDSARSTIGSMTAKQLDLSDSSGKPIGWEDKRLSDPGTFLPEFLPTMLNEKQGSERNYMVAGMGPRTVTNIYDADTIFLERDDSIGHAEKIRMLAIDAPEIISQYNKDKISKEEALMGDRSKQWLAKWLGGDEVNLTYSMDETENYGYYGRTLAYVYRASDGAFLQQEILKAGMAMYNKKFPAADKAMEDVLMNAQAYAMKHALGVWAPRDEIENLVALQEETDEVFSEGNYQPAVAMKDQMKQLFTDLQDMAYPLPEEFLESFKKAMLDIPKLFPRTPETSPEKEGFNQEIWDKIKKLYR